MNRSICKRQDQTTAAIRRGTINDEIASHAEHCPLCSEILLVGEFLQANTALMKDERFSLPDPGLVWQRAQRWATQEAARLAVRPIRFMKLVAVVAFAGSPWLRWLLPMGRQFAASWWKTFDLNVRFAPKIWQVAPNQATILLGCCGTILLLGLSSWYMLRQE